MTQKIPEGHGGSTLVKKDGEVKHSRGTVNPGEEGYADLVRKTPVESETHPGTLNRSPSYADLTTEEPKKPERADVASSSSSSSSSASSFTKPKGDK
jgi:hypothetical protein